MNKSYHYLAILCNIFQLSVADVILTSFRAQEEFGCYGNDPKKQIFQLNDVVSVAVCAEKCTSDARCLGVMYNQEENICIGCSDLVPSNDSNLYTFMRLESQESIPISANEELIETNTTFTDLSDFLWHGDACQSNTNCNDEFTVCIDGFCNCLAEYSFNPITDVCIQDCDVYGSTYIAHPGKNFNADILAYSNQISVYDCSTWCTNTEMCRSFSHSPTYDTGGWCSIQTSTPRIKPAHYFYSEHNFTFYIRNCADFIRK